MRVPPLVIVCGYLTSVRSATVDPVVYWNSVTEAAFARAVTAGRPQQAIGLDYAMVHTAVHDAVQAFEKRFKPYHSDIAKPDGGSPVAAVAKAAHDVLVSLYPAQETAPDGGLNAIYDKYLTDNSLAANDKGVFVGQEAAQGIINLRKLDGRFLPLDSRPCGDPGVGDNCIFRGGTAPGDWRPTESFNPGTPPSFAPMAVVWLGKVKPFVMTSPQQFRPEPPPALTSGEYRRAYNEVKAVGSLTSTTRTPEQTQLAYFYADSFPLVWSRAVNRIAAAHTDNIGDSARLFALVYLAVADSGITAWDNKKYFNFWRPLTAIREGDNDTNSRTAGDTTWKPFLNTPPYPDYTSGANNITGAVTRMLALFFHTDTMTFTVNSNYALANPNTRTYTHFSDAAKDVVNVRIYQGIHFRFADTAARAQSRRVANWTYKHFLTPLDNDDDDDDGDDHDRDEGDD
jgi:hypothetical protein